MNNLQSIFDAITGFGGASVTDAWNTMSREELSVLADGLADIFKPVSEAEADVIADAVVAMRACNGDGIARHTDTSYVIYDSLELYSDKLLAAKLSVQGASISMPSSLTPGEIAAMCKACLVADMSGEGEAPAYEATEYAADLIFGRL